MHSPTPSRQPVVAPASLRSETLRLNPDGRKPRVGSGKDVDPTMSTLRLVGAHLRGWMGVARHRRQIQSGLRQELRSRVRFLNAVFAFAGLFRDKLPALECLGRGLYLDKGNADARRSSAFGRSIVAHQRQAPA